MKFRLQRQLYEKFFTVFLCFQICFSWNSVLTPFEQPFTHFEQKLPQDFLMFLWDPKGNIDSKQVNKICYYCNPFWATQKIVRFSNVFRVSQKRKVAQYGLIISFISLIKFTAYILIFVLVLVFKYISFHMKSFCYSKFYFCSWCLFEF